MSDNMTFCDVVKSEFAFLLHELDFTLSREAASEKIEYVEYLSPQVYVRVIRTGPDFEPKLVFGRVRNDDETESFDWVDLKEMSCCREWKWQSNPDKPFNGRISELARLLRECGQSCLSGDSEAYAFLMNRREELRRVHVFEERQSHVKHEAERAWSDKRYRDYVSILSEFREHLSTLEQSKFDYALKQCNASCN